MRQTHHLKPLPTIINETSNYEINYHVVSNLLCVSCVISSVDWTRRN